MIRLDVNIVGDLFHRDLSVFLQDLREHAFMVRLQVLHQNIRHSGGFGNSLEEPFECLQSAGRSADPHYGKVIGRKMSRNTLIVRSGHTTASDMKLRFIWE